MTPTESSASLTELRRLVRIGGLVAWLMVGLPLLFQSGLDPGRVAGWAPASIGFALAAWYSAGAKRERALALLAFQVACVVAMVLLLCDGFEGALLVLVALQLGGRVPRRIGILWIVAQSALLAGAIAIHWSPRPALLLVPPYVGFELLAFFVADVLARDAAARALVEENSRLAERLRIARELHDVVGHRLTALSINLEVASRAAEASARESIASAHALARAALQEVRAVVAQLRDPERLELSDSLRTLAAETPGPRIHLTVPDALCRNDAGCALTLLRCTQEILTNAVRHAEAENLWIEIVESNGCIRLRARDDGRGADNLRLGHGLRGMHERIERAGGKMEIETRPGAGFSVQVTLKPAAQSDR
jgi:signal transduction histidine kinase